jgi:hypothetical protein
MERWQSLVYCAALEMRKTPTRGLGGSNPPLSSSQASSKPPDLNEYGPHCKAL